MEETILRTLEFSCHHVSPIPFVERFLHLLGIENDSESLAHQQIETLSKQYVLAMQRSTTFLKYRPSQIASASVLCAVNISVSDISTELDLTCVNEQEIKLNSDPTKVASK